MTVPSRHTDKNLPQTKIPKSDPAWPNEGEGNKSADVEYRKGLRNFVNSGQVQEKAKEAAAALDSSAGKDLREAEKKGRKKAR